jgi:hypothetical protein
LIFGHHGLRAGARFSRVAIILAWAVMHTMLWLKDDYTGLGDDYSDLKELLILLAVNGEQVLLVYADSPDKFDERYPLVQEIFNSITFTK